ncbi:MAG: phosphoribosylanthranilate isomerase [Candidatus Omnitrophota bacterium]
MAKVKICGLTNADDAVKAEDEGADFLGFIFFSKSPRAVSPKKVSSIVRALGGRALKVGLFLDQDLTYVLERARECGLDMVQLHGGESPDYVREVKNEFKVIKTFRIGSSSDAEKTKGYGVADYFLFDTLKPGVPGGTGEVFDWGLIEGVKFDRPVFLAGGLKPSNVRQAIERVKPYAVDVASGVEAAPGKKDHRLIKEFIYAAK